MYNAICTKNICKITKIKGYVLIFGDELYKKIKHTIRCLNISCRSIGLRKSIYSMIYDYSGGMVKKKKIYN